jgi:hypothetical protein
LKKQFHYLIAKIKVNLDREVVVKNYLEELSKAPTVVERMSSEEGIA